MNNNLLIIKKNPEFTVSFLKDSFEIKKDNNPFNNRLYQYINVKAIYLKKEQSIFSYIIGSLISLILAFDGTKKNKVVLVIETKTSKDTYYLENCDMNKINKFTDKINTRIKTN